LDIWKGLYEPQLYSGANYYKWNKGLVMEKNLDSKKRERVRVVVGLVQCPPGMWAIKPTLTYSYTVWSVRGFLPNFFPHLSTKRVNYRRFVVFKSSSVDGDYLKSQWLIVQFARKKNNTDSRYNDNGQNTTHEPATLVQ